MANRKTYNATDSIEQLLFIEIKKGQFGGYKQDWLINSLSELEIEFYICTKCNGVMRNACQIGEEQMLVCETCALQEHKSQPLAKSRKKILELRVKCPLENRGCEWNGTIAEIIAHLRSGCSELIMSCGNMCGVIMKRSELINHYKNECQNRKVNCEHCKQEIKWKMLGNHHSTCVEFPLPCPNECLKDLTRKEVELHIQSECPNTLLNCENECGSKLKRSEMQNHCERECLNRKIQCNHCSVIIQYKEIDTHNGTCPEFPLLCPNECMRSFTRKEVALHVNNECPNTILHCENECGRKIKRSGMQNHYKNECQDRKIHCIQCSVIIQYKEIDTHNGTCPEFPLLCPNECLKNLIRKEIESHIKNDCPNTIIECPYKEMGCEETMKRCEIEEHEQRSESRHLKNVVIYFSNEVKQMKSNFKSQEQTYEREIKELKSENEKLKTKGGKTERSLMKMDNEIKDLAELIFYPIVLRGQIGEGIMKSILEGKAPIFKEILTDKKEFLWNQNKFFLHINYKRDEELISASVTTVSVKKSSIRVKFKIKFLDLKNAYNSCVFESIESPLSKGAFHIAEFHEDLLLEEGFKNKNKSISFTLQVKEVDEFSW